MSNCFSFQAKLASILDVLAKTAVAEIIKLVDDGSTALRLEMCRSQRENEALKRKLLLMERDLWTLRGNGEGTPDNSLNISFEVQVCDEFREAPRRNANHSTDKVTRGRFENCSPVSMKTEDACSQSTLIKLEPVDGEQDWSERLMLGGDLMDVDLEKSQSQTEQKISGENACDTSQAAAGTAYGGEGPPCNEEEEGAELHSLPFPAGDPEKGFLMEPKPDPEGLPLAPPPPLMEAWWAGSEGPGLGAALEKHGQRGREDAQRETQRDVPPLSAAEKQRRYRARRDADPQKREQYLEKEKDKWKADKETGKKLLQKDRTESGQHAQRKRWKEAYERRNARKKTLEALSTSPMSPESPVTPEIPFRVQMPESSSSSRHQYEKPCCSTQLWLMKCIQSTKIQGERVTGNSLQE